MYRIVGQRGGIEGQTGRGHLQARGTELHRVAVAASFLVRTCQQSAQQAKNNVSISSRWMMMEAVEVDMLSSVGVASSLTWQMSGLPGSHNHCCADTCALF